MLVPDQFHGLSGPSGRFMAIFIYSEHLHGPLSPPFLQPSKMSVSANYFLCRPFAWSAPLLVIISSFFATVKNYQPNLIMHTFFVWRDLHLSHCSKQNVRFFIVDWMMKSAWSLAWRKAWYIEELIIRAKVKQSYRMTNKRHPLVLCSIHCVPVCLNDI